MPGYPHRIRLRGPWECVDADLSTPRRVTLPCQLRLAGASACLSRKFGYPGQIDFYERVWLTFADVMGTASFSVNGTPVGTAAGTCEFDVTKLLKPHNRLELVWPAVSEEAGLGDVALLVRCAVFLGNLQASRAGGELAITGELIGTWPEPLDLYFFINDEQFHYESLQTTGERTPITPSWGTPRKDQPVCASTWCRGHRCGGAKK